MDDDDWLSSVSRLEGSTPEDVETAKLIMTHRGTIPAELAESDQVKRLERLDCLEVRPARGSDEYEYMRIVHIANARWQMKPG